MDVSGREQGIKKFPNSSPEASKFNLLSASYNFILAILLMSFLGYKLDERWGKGNYFFTMGGFFLGLAWGFYDIFKKVKMLESSDRKK